MRQRRLIFFVLTYARCSSAVLLDSPQDFAVQQDPALANLLAGCFGATCLERYINFDDGAYSWSHLRTFPHGNQEVHELHLSSLQWQLARPKTWQHTIWICNPPAESQRFPGWATLLLNDVTMLRVCNFAAATGAVGIALTNIPQQNVDIVGNSSKRHDEEYIRARSWKMYADHPTHPEFVMEMAQAKATSRAMDAIQEYADSIDSSINKFIVTGASKRAVAAYTACAFDSSRVRAIMPEIILLRMGRASIVPRPGKRGRRTTLWKPSNLFFDELPDKKAKKDIYGEYIGKEKTYKTLSPAFVQAYDSLATGKVLSVDDDGEVDEGIYEDLGIEDFSISTARRVYSINDPYWYIERLTCGPILVQNVGNDCWFGPFVTRDYFSDLPNAAFQMHGPSPHRVFIEPHMATMRAFVSGVIRGLEMPRIKWNISLTTGDIDFALDNYLEIALGDVIYPSSVSVWRAESDNEEHFQDWSETTLALDGRATNWHVKTPKRQRREFVAHYVAVEYDFPPGTEHKYRVTTEVSTFPNDDLLGHLNRQNMIRRKGSGYEYVLPNAR